MSVVTRNPTTDVQSGGNAWGSPANAYALDAVYAFGPTDPGLGVSLGAWGTYGFDGAIPVGAAITKVEVLVTGHHDPGAPDPSCYALVSGVQQGAAHGVTWTTTDSTFAVDITADRSWVRADLLDGVLTVECDAGNGGVGTPNDNLDALQVRVTFTTAGSLVYRDAGQRASRPLLAKPYGAPQTAAFIADQGQPVVSSAIPIPPLFQRGVAAPNAGPQPLSIVASWSPPADRPLPTPFQRGVIQPAPGSQPLFVTSSYVTNDVPPPPLFQRGVAASPPGTQPLVTPWVQLVVTPPLLSYFRWQPPVGSGQPGAQPIGKAALIADQGQPAVVAPIVPATRTFAGPAAPAPATQPLKLIATQVLGDFPVPALFQRGVAAPAAAGQPLQPAWTATIPSDRAIPGPFQWGVPSSPSAKQPSITIASWTPASDFPLPTAFQRGVPSPNLGTQPLIDFASWVLPLAAAPDLVFTRTLASALPAPLGATQPWPLPIAAWALPGLVSTPAVVSTEGPWRRLYPGSGILPTEVWLKQREERLARRKKAAWRLLS